MQSTAGFVLGKQVRIPALISHFGERIATAELKPAVWTDA